MVESLKSFWVFRGEERGRGGETIYRSPFLTAGNSLIGRAISQAVIALGSLVTLVKNRRALRDVDVVIGTVPALPTALVAALAARMLRKPYAIDLRDAWPDLLDDYRNWNRATGDQRSARDSVLLLAMPIVKFAAGRVFSRILRQASAVIVTSNHLKEHLERELRAHPAYSGAKVSTIRNVFPPETIPKEKNSRGKRAGLRVLYAGTLGRAQNLRNAIDAASLLLDGKYNVELKFVGTGAGESDLKSYAHSRGVPVSFEEVRPAQSLEDFYMWADTALVHLTDWEPLSRAVPSKTYELMAHKLHISCVATGEVADLVTDLKAGHVVPPERPIELSELWVNLIDNPQLMQIDGSGEAWVTKERDEIIPDRLAEVLRDLAELSSND